MDFVVYGCIVWFRLSLEDQLDMNILVQLPVPVVATDVEHCCQSIWKILPNYTIEYTNQW